MTGLSAFLFQLVGLASASRGVPMRVACTLVPPYRSHGTCRLTRPSRKLTRLAQKDRICRLFQRIFFSRTDF